MDGKHSQEWQCCTFLFIYIIFYFVSGIYKHYWKYNLLCVSKITALEQPAMYIYKSERTEL
jgi:hypothetical protein